MRINSGIFGFGSLKIEERTLKSAGRAPVLNRMTALVEIAGDDLFSAPDEAGVAVPAPLGHQSLQTAKGNFELKFHLLGIGVRAPAFF